MDELDLNIYAIAELRYKEEHINEENIFPVDWYSSKNYKLKTEIIAQAIKNKTTIENTELYQTKFIERVEQ